MSDILEQTMRRAAELVATAKPDTILKDPQLKEFCNSALDTIILKLANQGLNTLRQEVILLAVPALTTILSDTTVPALPAMFAPVRVWERSAGGIGWGQLGKVMDHLPVNAAQTTSLGWWEWRASALWFVGSTTPSDLKIHYVPRAEQFQMPRDPFGFPDLVNPVAFLAASRAVGGNDYYEQVANGDLYAIMSIQSHVEQSTPVRIKRRRSGGRRY